MNARGAGKRRLKARRNTKGRGSGAVVAGKQRGAALLIALVVVAAASLLATGLLERMQRDRARSEAIWQGERSWQYAQGMEAVARRLLREAADSGLSAGDIDGQWTDALPVPGGEVRGRVLDQSGRFNLNLLAAPDSGRRQDAHARFQRLLSLLALPPGIADELADWIEGAAVPRPRGAGNNWYTAQQPPYQVPGRPLAHASELRWLKSVDAAAWETLAPHVTALPVGENIHGTDRIHVNTASPAVLASLSPTLDLERARRLAQDAPYASTDRFLEHPVLRTVDPNALRPLVTSSGNWYLVQARVTLGGVTRNYFRLISRNPIEYDFRYVSIGRS